jgi:hypothetical protein
VKSVRTPQLEAAGSPWRSPGWRLCRWRPRGCVAASSPWPGGTAEGGIGSGQGARSADCEEAKIAAQQNHITRLHRRIEERDNRIAELEAGGDLRGLLRAARLETACYREDRQLGRSGWSSKIQTSVGALRVVVLRVTSSRHSRASRSLRELATTTTYSVLEARPHPGVSEDRQLHTPPPTPWPLRDPRSCHAVQVVASQDNELTPARGR